MFNSDARQDQFVANLFKFKTNGTYLDIGSCGSIGSNNSFYFDSCLGWKGVCIEIESMYNYTYSSRKNCEYINKNALEINYKEVLSNLSQDKSIDYLSLDIDTLNINVLKILPFDSFQFRVITVEHDGYLYGNKYRIEQRRILNDKGYDLICSNVLVEQSGYEGQHLPFEDWWVLKNEFCPELLDKLRCDEIYPSEIISKFNG